MTEPFPIACEQCRGKLVVFNEGHNFLMSRDMLLQGSTLVFSGQAKSVLRVRNILVSAGVACEITPDFCWI
ncbi:hypothetical protein EMIT0347P_20353 [Pseudomonas sp. IT-347P]